MIKIVPFPKIDLLRKKLKDEKVVLAGGAFDILHTGHIKHLKKARSFGSVLIVHITGDKRYQEKKGGEKPVFSDTERAEIVSSLKMVDYVFVYNGRHYDKKVVQKLKPDVIFFNREAYSPEIQKYLQKYPPHCRIIVSTLPKKTSSTKIKKLLRKLK